MQRVLPVLLCTSCAAAAPGARQAQPVAHHSSYVTVNGIRTYYEVHGSGPPLLLLHGATVSIETFDQQVAFFSPRYRVIAPERMGHGRTEDKPERPFDFHQMTEDTAAFMQVIGVERADLIGWSDGGNIALDLAMNHPERIRRMAITGANFRVDGLAPEVIDWIKQVKPEEFDAAVVAAYKRLSPDGPDHWPGVFERLRNMNLTQPAYTVEQLRSIKTPTLVMGGDKDLVRLEHLVEMARSIPDAQLCIYPGATHGWMIEKADAFNTIVQAFLAQPRQP